MKSLTMVRGRIDTKWAESVDALDVWRTNWLYRHGDDYEQKKLNIYEYRSLGGLTVLVSQKVFTPSALERFAERRLRSVINLADEAPGRLTSTGLLVAGSLENPDLDIGTVMMQASMDGPYGKLQEDGNDTWVIPDAAITLIEDQTVELQLPHQRD